MDQFIITLFKYNGSIKCSIVGGMREYMMVMSLEKFNDFIGIVPTYFIPDLIETILEFSSFNKIKLLIDHKIIMSSTLIDKMSVLHKYLDLHKWKVFSIDLEVVSLLIENNCYEYNDVIDGIIYINRGYPNEIWSRIKDMIKEVQNS